MFCKCDLTMNNYPKQFFRISTCYISSSHFFIRKGTQKKVTFICIFGVEEPTLSRRHKQSRKHLSGNKTQFHNYMEYVTISEKRAYFSAIDAIVLCVSVDLAKGFQASLNMKKLLLRLVNNRNHKDQFKIQARCWHNNIYLTRFILSASFMKFT